MGQEVGGSENGEFLLIFKIMIYRGREDQTVNLVDKFLKKIYQLVLCLTQIKAETIWFLIVVLSHQSTTV